MTNLNAGPPTSGLEELARLIHFRVGAWQDFGYEDPPAPDCKAVPPLGERSAEAIKSGHEAIGDIDQLIRQLYDVRSRLVSQLRRDEDIRMARPLPGIEGPAQ
ncbi:MAG: hypothetical protein JWM19_5825 [Actinomycetia bacterium]|nr:hypothetical protein [Actinomycetes bacterium]